jgi:hypothetical protein
MATATDITLYSPEFIERIKAFKSEIHQFYTEIGQEETPALDGSGRKIIDKRPDGKDYIIEGYMRKKLDQYFPGWSLEMAAPLHFLGAEWVVAQVNLAIIDEKLLAFGIIPPVRKFYGVDSVRVQYKRDSTHEPGNIIDVGDNCKQAVSAAFKYAINRLTNIGDDVYGKRMDLEGAGTIDSIIMSNNGDTGIVRDMFMKFLSDKKILPSKAFIILGVKSFTDVTDWKGAYQKIKESLS